MKNIPYARQSILPEDIDAVIEVLRSDYLTQGPQVELFESEFARFVQAPFATAVTNGTAALHLAALALGVKPGDRVLVTPNTFVASANCIRYCGADVEFVDIDKDTLCMDLAKLRIQLEAKPKGYYRGVVFVDFAGYCMDLHGLRELAKAHDLWILEDACHAVGAEAQDAHGNWQRAGNGRAEMTVFSFHPVKHLAAGEGGMITTSNVKLDQQVKLLRSHGIVRKADKMSGSDGPWFYEMQELGFNYRISDILCALGRSQLRRLDHNLSARRALAATYFHELANLPIKLPKVPDGVRHAYHLFVIEVSERKRLYEFLREHGIFTQVHYIPVHTHPYYVELYGAQSLPVVENYYACTLSLPMFHALGREDQARVIGCLKEFYR